MWEAKIDESLAIEGTHLHPFIPDSLAGPRKILTSYENSRSNAGMDSRTEKTRLRSRGPGAAHCFQNPRRFPGIHRQAAGLGYKHPDPDELIAMRIHQVTPEYISDLRLRGMHDLSIDQLVSMRIHGID